MTTHNSLSKEYQDLVKDFGDALQASPHDITYDEIKILRRDLDRFVYALLARAGK